MFSHRRTQFMAWKSQAANNAVKTVRGCFTLAQRELASWRRTMKPERKEQRSSPRKRQSLQRSRTNSRISGDSSKSSLSSITDLDEEQRKEQYRSDFSLPVRRSSSLEMKHRFSGFAETTSGSLERLLLVNALELNESDDEDGEDPTTSRHLPFRATVVNGEVHILKNEWV
ncbi:hypothetical protein PHMEG_00020572 [Phytophthora megakarya]|uniref:Uncharacterized protein n=1 Tax=Phytophthora megakarya TaxID=4795 RepID=A0A225VRC2_9STRA|nr:hypothetical protein PHMEG_00020572 [Phytophthora megakarya]